jgi:hypothetical protein
MTINSLPLICLLDILVSVSAWGPGVDPAMKGFRRASSLLRAHPRDQDPEEADLIEVYRSNLQSSYVSYYEDEHEVYDLIKKYGKSEDAASVPKSISRNWRENCGEDCEDCEIPNDFKILPGAVNPVDVMDFLGIRRAEPLRKYSDWN